MEHPALLLIVFLAAYCIRGGQLDHLLAEGQPADHGVPDLIGRLLWADAVGYALHDPGAGLGAFLGMSFISHGAYYAMGPQTGNHTLWLGPNDTYWQCFRAMALIGFLRGVLLYWPAGGWWQPLAFAILYPVCATIGKWTSKKEPVAWQERFSAVAYAMLALPL